MLIFLGNNMSGFSVGDVVELSSGGCDLCVMEIDQNQPNDIHCVWFNDALEGLPRTFAFSLDTLKIKIALPNRTVLKYMHNMQVGDVVKLRCGSPLMTVDSVAGLKISCTWFDKNQLNPLQYTFPSVVLVEV